MRSFFRRLMRGLWLPVLAIIIGGITIVISVDNPGGAEGLYHLAQLFALATISSGLIVGYAVVRLVIDIVT